jgi:multiple sugar transport system substrate-binding protein
VIWRLFPFLGVTRRYSPFPRRSFCSGLFTTITPRSRVTQSKQRGGGDTVTYPDNTQEPMDLHVLPMPKTAGADALMTQAGVGLCAYKTTAQKAEAAALFVRWLTEAERNLDFVAQTGYMPVRSGAFDAILDYDNFPAPAAAYESLYAALKTMREDYTPVSEPRFEGYYGRVSVLYDGLRQLQKELPKRAAAGEDIDALAEETWALFCSIR